MKEDCRRYHGILDEAVGAKEQETYTKCNMPGDPF